MRNVLSAVMSLVACCLLAAGLPAADAKEVTLKGGLACAKCELKQSKKCANALVVKEGDKEVVYLLLDGRSAVDHEAVCGGGRLPAAVTGVVSEKDGRKFLTVSEVKLAK